MRAIVKGIEPNSLTQHRKQSHSDYNNYQQKDELREALVREQRGLCCYCTSRIRATSTAMKIEHWQSQKTYPKYQLAYGNMLAACRGGEGQAEKHCDTLKGDHDLQWNPANAAHMIETRLQYRPDGTIQSTDEIFGTQLDEVLGLNLPFLRNNRKAVLDSLLVWWRTAQPVPRKKIQARIDNRINNIGEQTAFSPVAIWYLRQKLLAVAP